MSLEFDIMRFWTTKFKAEVYAGADVAYTLPEMAVIVLID